MKSRYTVEFHLIQRQSEFRVFRDKQTNSMGTRGIMHEDTWNMRAKCHGVGLHEKGMWCEGHRA